MNQVIEELYKEIGASALGHAPDIAGTILVYSEVEDGVISADVFYITPLNVVRLRFGTASLQDLIYSFWEQWKKSMEGGAWSVMCYLIEDGKFRIDLSYPDQINPNESIIERRPRALVKYFGSRKVDYSNPR